ncbi:MAG: class I SAM-dependent methyltransferase [Chitinophagaceae bacterium]|nr:class I SAM-dependent methyltransferase [Anaerolineae bacterium]
MSALNDPEAVRQQYATDESLRIRQEIHDKYTVPQIDYAGWVLNCVEWRGDEHILDAGCGAGMYYPLLKDKFPDLIYHGLDFSPGMLGKHPAANTLVLADAQFAPYADHTFDVVMANHMLYHMPDIDEALVEFRRVLKPDGVLMVATNSLQTMPELQVLMRRAIVLLTRTGASQVQPPVPASDLFALENGSRQLARHFYAVVRHDLPSALIFPEIEPIMAYLESTRSIREPQLPRDVMWDDVMMIMRQQITHLINHLGELVINKLTGVLLASDSGGFIQQFVEASVHSAPLTDS